MIATNNKKERKRKTTKREKQTTKNRPATQVSVRLLI
jgi:hypothetical protein